MRVLRAWTAILLVAFAAGGVHAHGWEVAQSAAQPGVAAESGLNPVDPPAFLVAGLAIPMAALEAGTGPGHALTISSLRLLPAPRRCHRAARIAAIELDRLGFAHALDAARIGYFSFGGTAPPPLRA